MAQLLQARELSKRYGSTIVLDQVSFSIDSAQLVWVSGPNGAGKSTLLRILAGLTQADHGEVMRPAVSYCGHGLGLYVDCTCRQNLDIFVPIDAQIDVDQLDMYITQFGLGPHMHKQIRNVSQGTAQKLSLSLCMASRAPVWIMDEPLAALDHSSRTVVYQAIRQKIEAGDAVCWTTHLLPDEFDTDQLVRVQL